MQVWMRRGLKGFEPVDDFAFEAFRKVPVGAIVRVNFSRPRNVQHHRKFFALLRTVQKATGLWTSEEDLLVELKVRLGIVREYVIRGSGEVVKIPGSINFVSMDQDEFNEFYERALSELADMAGGIDNDELRDAVLQELSA